MDLTEALKFIFGQAETYADPKPQVRRIGALKQVVTIRGESHEEALEPKSLNHRARTIASLIEIINRFGGEQSVAYVNVDGIVVVLDTATRLETAKLTFEPSPQTLAFDRLKQGVPQYEMVKLLRTKLFGCIDHDGLIDIMKNIEFDVNRGTRGSVNHQKESLGRSVEMEVRAKAGEIPEVVRVRMPLLDVPSCCSTFVAFDAAIMLDAQKELIALEPVGTQLTDEYDRVVGEIMTDLESQVSDKTLVVFGDHELVEHPWNR